MQLEPSSDPGPRMNPATAWAICIALVVVAAIGDRATGPFVSFDLFYLVPVLVAARWIGRTPALGLTLLCAALAVAMQVLMGHPVGSQPFLTVWAALVKFGVWGSAVWLVSDRQRHVERMEGLVLELRAAMSEIKQLKGLLPVCAWCKRMRTQEGAWLRLEDYLQETTNASVTHGMCPDCAASAAEKLEKARSKG